MLRTLMIVAGIVEILVGLPALVTAATSIEMFFGGGGGEAAEFMTRLFGAAALALGIAALLARNHLKPQGGIAIVYGLTTYILLGAVLLAWAGALGLGGTLLLMGAVYHALMGAALVYAINSELGPWVRQG
ncbi:MAG: hypothetical protein FJX44_08725 [Alphaproteobacteria bacterium]|nr:hypothetical protein [Alphaproteobacteria bacterium]